MYGLLYNSAHVTVILLLYLSQLTYRQNIYNLKLVSACKCFFLPRTCPCNHCICAHLNPYLNTTGGACVDVTSSIASNTHTHLSHSTGNSSLCYWLITCWVSVLLVHLPRQGHQWAPEQGLQVPSKASQELTLRQTLDSGQIESQM